MFGLRSPAATPTTGGVNVSAIWAQIFATSPPAAFPPIPSTHPVTLSPSTEAVLNRKQRRQRAGVGISVAIISVVIAFGLGGIAILLGIGGILIGILIAKTGPSKELHQRLKRELVDAETQWQGIVKQWDDASRGASFLLKRGELETSKIQLEKLPSEELLQLKTLEAARERRQREEYLRTRLIAHATISGIGPARAATLAAYGIRSAADVNVSAILRIPGFGETYALNLASWRQVVERQFILRPPQGADLAAIAALKQEMNLLRARLEQQLCDGPQLLEQIGKQRAAQHAKLLVLAAQALQAKAQAEVNLIGS